MTDAVLLAGGVNALGVARSLGLRGVTCHLITTSGNEFVTRSRYIASHCIVRDLDDETLHEALHQIRREGAALLASSDALIDFLVRNQRRLSRHYALRVSSPALARTLLDKLLETRRIAGLGIPLPETYRELASCDLSQIRYPAIVKPRDHRGVAELGMKNFVVGSAAELANFVASPRHDPDRYIAQEVIPNCEFNVWTCSAFFDTEHELATNFVSKRWRSTPARYGVTSLGVSRREPRVTELARSIGAALEYVGPATLEFLLDRRDEEFKFIEMDPRIGRSCFFDTQCGVPTVYNSYLSALGRPPERGTQRDGVVFSSVLIDIKTRLEGGESRCGVFASHASGLFRKRVGAHWFWKDPVPGLIVLAGSFARLVRRALSARGW